MHPIGPCPLLVRCRVLASPLQTSRLLLLPALACAGFLAAAPASTADQKVALAWSTSTDPSVVGYKIYYGATSGTYTNQVNVGNVTNAAVSGLVAKVTYYFTATTYNSDGVESDRSNEISYTVPAPAVGGACPTLHGIGNLVIYENAGLQTLTLTGISSGVTNSTSTLVLTATSSNPGLVTPIIHYTSPATTGTLSFTPAPNATGGAFITVWLTDGQATNDTSYRAFWVRVKPTNQPPTLDGISDMVVNPNAGLQTVVLTGITSGATNEHQALTVTATSSNPGLISPIVRYASPATAGQLNFAPAINQSGAAVITVCVNDGQPTNNSTCRAFSVTVSPPVIANVLTEPSPSLRLQTRRPTPSSPVQLLISGPIGRTCQVEFCDTLSATNWIPLAVLLLTNGSSLWVDDSPPVPRRFYRAILEP